MNVEVFGREAVGPDFFFLSTPTLHEAQHCTLPSKNKQALERHSHGSWLYWAPCHLSVAMFLLHCLRAHAHFWPNTHCKVSGVKTAFKCRSESLKWSFYVLNMTLPKLQWLSFMFVEAASQYALAVLQCPLIISFFGVVVSASVYAVINSFPTSAF